MPGSQALSVKRLKLEIGDKKLIDDISFSVPTQKKVAIVGLNGAGKSSLIRLLIGEFFPDSGNIHFQQLTPSDLEFKKQSGYQASAMQPIDNFSAKEYLQMCCLLKNINVSQITQAIEIIVTKWCLGDILNKPMQKLSQGNLQKLMIAQAFLGEPQFILLDEPTQALDPIEQKRFIDNLTSLTNYQVCLFSSHHINEAVEAADYVLMLHQGKLVALVDLNINNEYWLVSKLTSQQIVLLSGSELSIGVSYQNKNNLYQLKNISSDKYQVLLDILFKEDLSLIDLGSASEALMPLFSLLANERL